MGFWKNALLASALALAPISFAASTNSILSSFCVSSSSDGVCSSVNLPSDGNDLYIQLTAPSSSGWAAVGIGSQMMGALIFLMYPSSDGKNITLSPRLGLGEFQPNFDSSIEYTLLSGTGISDSLMTANVKCSNCRTWSGGSIDTSSTSQNFIWAVGSGETIRSDSTSYSIQEHSQKGFFAQDIVAATGGNSSNPFLYAATASSSNSNTGKSIAPPMTRETKILIAHGTMMGVTFVILLPLGAAFISLINRRLSNAVATHRVVQIFGSLLIVIGFALGVWYSDVQHTHYTHSHQYLGTVILGLVFLQITLGIFHHSTYLKTQARSLWSHGHIWLGRSVIILGIVNGGLGLQLAGAGEDWFITYSIIAVAVCASYAFFYFMKTRKERKAAALAGKF
ncbi:hypothetical protein RUND412_001585 [Rhizina undulata]